MNGLRLSAAAAALAAAPVTALTDTQGSSFINHAENCAVEAMNVIDLSGIETPFQTSTHNTYQVRTFSEGGLEESETYKRTFDLYGANHEEVEIEATVRIVNGPTATLAEFEVRHDGTKGSYTDASRSGITLQFIDGALGKRTGFATTSEFGVNITDQVHGQWTLDAAQALEASFMNCIGQEQHLSRPTSAATSADTAPSFLEQRP